MCATIFELPSNISIVSLLSMGEFPGGKLACSTIVRGSIEAGNVNNLSKYLFSPRRGCQMAPQGIEKCPKINWFLLQMFLRFYLQFS